MKENILPIAGLVILVLLFLAPYFLFDNSKVIHLPSGNFQKVSIVSAARISEFEVSADKMKEFEAGFRKCAQDAIPLKGDPGVIPTKVLTIEADNGKYVVDIDYNDKDVLIIGGFFHRSFRSTDIRKLFHDAGLKYDSEIQPAQDNEVNQP